MHEEYEYFTAAFPILMAVVGLAVFLGGLGACVGGLWQAAMAVEDGLALAGIGALFMFAGTYAVAFGLLTPTKIVLTEYRVGLGFVFGSRMAWYEREQVRWRYIKGFEVVLADVEGRPWLTFPFHLRWLMNGKRLVKSLGLE